MSIYRSFLSHFDRIVFNQERSCFQSWTPRVRTCWLRFVYISNFPNRAKHYARTTAAVAEPKQNVQQPQSAWWESKIEFECFRDAIVLQGSVLQFRSHHWIPYFVPFIYRIFESNWSIQNKNLEKTPKCDSSPQESSTSQLGGSIGVAKFAKSSSSSRSETASAWWHEKEVLLHRRSPNFELVEINSTLSCKELSVSKFKRIFKDAKTDECLTDAVEAFEIVSTWNWR